MRSAQPGDRLLLDDGRIELRVTERSADELRTVVVTRRPARRAQGHQRARRGAAGFVASPTKDAADLRFGLELGVDIVALSFVQTADDVLTARARS